MKTFQILIFLFVEVVIWSLCFSEAVESEVSTDWFLPNASEEVFIARNRIYPILRIRYTVPPEDRERAAKNGTKFDLILLLPIGLVVLLVFLCKYLLSRPKKTVTTETTTTFYLPRTRILYPPPPRRNRNQRQYTNGTRLSNIRNHRNIRRASCSVIPEESTPNYIDDKPPTYFEVVVADLRGNSKKFPEVKPPDSPPPNYELRNLQKF